MNWKRIAPTGALVAAVALLFAQESSNAVIGQKAPLFAGKSGGTGKNVSLGNMLEKGPVFIYFIKKDCPVNARAEKFYNAVYDATKGNANFVGIINADQDQFARWQKRFNAPFPVILDHEQTLIGAYRAERSPWVIEVGKNGKIAKVWAGYSEGALKELIADIGKTSKVGPVDLEGTPSSMTFG